MTSSTIWCASRCLHCKGSPLMAITSALVSKKYLRRLLPNALNAKHSVGTKLQPCGQAGSVLWAAGNNSPVGKVSWGERQQRGLECWARLMKLMPHSRLIHKKLAHVLCMLLYLVCFLLIPTTFWIWENDFSLIFYYISFQCSGRLLE